MKTQRFAIGLTVLNLFILMSTLFRANSATTSEAAPVLRGRALEMSPRSSRWGRTSSDRNDWAVAMAEVVRLSGFQVFK
jgi:hypothetical protein